jgi:hypothetical protein
MSKKSVQLKTLSAGLKSITNNNNITKNPTRDSSHAPSSVRKKKLTNRAQALINSGTGMLLGSVLDQSEAVDQNSLPLWLFILPIVLIGAIGLLYFWWRNRK